MKRAAVLLVLASQVACTESLPPWQLDHDRILAVRANPPAIVAEAAATIDLLVGVEGGGPMIVPPASVTAADDASLVVITSVDDTWSVRAPDETTLAEARVVRALPVDAPVPVQLTVTVRIGADTFVAVKTLNLGAEAENPMLGEVTVGQQPVADGLSLAVGDEVPVAVDAVDPETDEVDWFTSVGMLEDTSDAVATLRVDEPAEGWLGVVVRDGRAGVTWGFWSLSSER